MNMFRLTGTGPFGSELRRLLLAGVVMMNTLVAALLLFVLILGWAGVLWFLGTWPLTALLGFFGGLVFIPDPKPS